MLSIQLFPGATPWRGINTENYEGGILRDTDLPFVKCPPQWFLLDPDESEQVILLCNYLYKRGGVQQVISYVVYLIMIDVSFR